MSNIFLKTVLFIFFSIVHTLNNSTMNEIVQYTYTSQIVSVINIFVFAIIETLTLRQCSSFQVLSSKIISVVVSPSLKLNWGTIVPTAASLIGDSKLLFLPVRRTKRRQLLFRMHSHKNQRNMP